MTPKQEAMREAVARAICWAFAKDTDDCSIKCLNAKRCMADPVEKCFLRDADAAIAAMHSVSTPDEGWQPIETAPKDGTCVDLWMVNEKGEGWREADAFYVRDTTDYFTVFDGKGGHHDASEKRDGWFAPNHDYDGMSGFCDQPVRLYGKPLAPTFDMATHWMPHPAPPAPSGGGQG